LSWVFNNIDWRHVIEKIIDKKTELKISDTKLKVLIIDDEAEICDEISEKLEFHGYQCLIAKDSQSGLDLINIDREISIVLTDIRMPGMSGLEMCDIIKSKASEGREFALLVMTGHAGLCDAIKALKVGALDFLTKPLSPEFLVHAVNRADQHIKSRIMEQNFNKTLKNQVEVMTVDLFEKAYELKRSNKCLINSNQVKDEFLRMVSHELRTPLAAIVGLTDVIISSVNDPQQIILLDKIKESGWKLTNMVNCMIDLVAVRTKSLKLKIEDVNVSKMIDEAVISQQEKSKQLGITIEIKNISNFDFKLDNVRITHAIIYLIDNAINFSKYGGVVKVSSKLTDDGLSILIQDNGCGMSASDIKKALEPLRQVDGSLTKEHGGIGMGVFLSKSFIELHNGSIEFISELGSGTNVKIFIPKIKI
jgi:two-component system sensor histidine kinase/response regulator